MRNFKNYLNKNTAGTAGINAWGIDGLPPTMNQEAHQFIGE